MVLLLAQNIRPVPTAPPPAVPEFHLPLPPPVLAHCGTCAPVFMFVLKLPFFSKLIKTWLKKNIIN